jgi:hypothetical protein
MDRFLVLGPPCRHLRTSRARAPYRLRAAREVRCASARLLGFDAAPRARRGCAQRGAGQGHTPASGWCVYTGSGGTRFAAQDLRARDDGRQGRARIAQGSRRPESPLRSLTIAWVRG